MMGTVAGQQRATREVALVDVWRITLAAIRRWYILIPLLAVTGWGAWVAGEGIHPEYEVQATAMLLPGTTVSEVPNPYGGIDEANQAVAIVLSSAESLSQIAAQGLSTEYTVTPESRSNILRFSVRADDPETAVATGTALLDLVRNELSTRQDEAGVPSSSQIGIDVLAAPAVLDVVYEGKLRVQAIIGLLGASIALVVAVLFDDIVGLVKRRRRRRADLDTAPKPVEDEAAAEEPDQGAEHGAGEDEAQPRTSDYPGAPAADDGRRESAKVSSTIGD